ncbi:restriction modification system DNA specificity subunit [Caballeronia jiangsuensis]|nr:restriction modification system DNA specificity subunit [Caballeronia jiangsuensis]
MIGLVTKTVAQWQREGALLVEDGNHGDNRPRTQEFSSAGMAFIRAADMADGRVLFEQAEKINAVAQQRVRKGIGKPGDIIISHKGTIGRVARVDMVAPEFVCSPQTTFWRVMDEEKIDRDFLYALLRSPSFQGLFATRAGETDMAGYVSLTSQRELELSLPTIVIQRDIGRTIRLIDDKIELNRKMAATLEEIARALYRSWFVDFDPVRARAEGCTPAHMDAATAALFPDSFGEDGVPTGWRDGSLKDLIVFNPKERLPKGTIAPYFDMKALPTVGMVADKPIQRAFSSGTKFRSNDTLLARITPCLENGKTGMIEGLGENVVAWGSTEFIVMRARPGTPMALPYCVARDASFRDKAIATMTGSSGRQRADAEAISALAATVPPQAILNAFGDIVDPLIRRVHASGHERRNLSDLRDALLPRLISGELRVGAAREMIEEVA